VPTALSADSRQQLCHPGAVQTRAGSQCTPPPGGPWAGTCARTCAAATRSLAGCALRRTLRLAFFSARRALRLMGPLPLSAAAEPAHQQPVSQPADQAPNRQPCCPVRHTSVRLLGVTQRRPALLLAPSPLHPETLAIPEPCPLPAAPRPLPPAPPELTHLKRCAARHAAAWLCRRPSPPTQHRPARRRWRRSPPAQQRPVGGPAGRKCFGARLGQPRRIRPHRGVNPAPGPRQAGASLPTAPALAGCPAPPDPHLRVAGEVVEVAAALGAVPVQLPSLGRPHRSPLLWLGLACRQAAPGASTGSSASVSAPMRKPRPAAPQVALCQAMLSP
jgi:hypothetical protein